MSSDERESPCTTPSRRSFSLLGDWTMAKGQTKAVRRIEKAVRKAVKKGVTKGTVEKAVSQGMAKGPRRNLQSAWRRIYAHPRAPEGLSSGESVNVQLAIKRRSEGAWVPSWLSQEIVAPTHGSYNLTERTPKRAIRSQIRPFWAQHLGRNRWPLSPSPHFKIGDNFGRTDSNRRRGEKRGTTTRHIVGDARSRSFSAVNRPGLTVFAINVLAERVPKTCSKRRS
jgi:hypothetical protein